MATWVYDIQSIDQANLNDLIDDILDGALDRVGRYSDIKIERGPTTIAGAGDPPGNRVMLEFPASERGEAAMLEVLHAIEQLAGDIASVTVSRR